MLNDGRAGFSVFLTCMRDQGVQRLVTSTRTVPFRRVGHMACIEVVGIPVLRCQVCGEQRYDLTLLAHIESILRRHIEQGDVRTSYAFEQLAAEMTTDPLLSEKE